MPTLFGTIESFSANAIFLFLKYKVNKRLMLTRSIPGGQSHQSLHCLHMQNNEFNICIFLLSKAYTSSTSISDLPELDMEIQVLLGLTP